MENKGTLWFHLHLKPFKRKPLYVPDAFLKTRPLGQGESSVDREDSRMRKIGEVGESL